MITVSLKEILDAGPCKNGFLRALHARGKITKDTFDEFMENEYIETCDNLPYDILTLADDEQFPAASVIAKTTLMDALWALRIRSEYSNLWRKYAVWCARQVQHLMKDDRSINALDVAWRYSDGLATDEELDAASVAARDAARDASSGAARAASSAAQDASSGAARAAAWKAASSAARAAAREAARGDAWGDAWEAARGDALDVQAEKLIEILNAGEWVE